MRYRLAIFDFDGTLADSFPSFLGIVNQAAERFGFRRIEEHELERLRSFSAREMVQHLAVPVWKLPLVARFIRQKLAEEADRLSLFPGIEDALQELNRAGVTLAIVTSNSERNVRRILGPANSALIGHFACSAAIFGKRPKIRQVLHASGIPRDFTICIGDEIRDIEAARAEEVVFGAVTWGYTHAEALRACNPKEIFETPEEMSSKLLTEKDFPHPL